MPDLGRDVHQADGLRSDSIHQADRTRANYVSENDGIPDPISVRRIPAPAEIDLMSARRTPAPADDRNQVTPIDPDSVVVSDRTR